MRSKIIAGKIMILPKSCVRILLCLLLTVVSVSAQSLVLDEAMNASNWHGTNGARVGKTVFLSGDGHTGNGLEMELWRRGRSFTPLTLTLTHTNWSNYSTLRIRTFTDEPFEMPLEIRLLDGACRSDGVREKPCRPSMPIGSPGWNEVVIKLEQQPGVDFTTVQTLTIHAPDPWLRNSAPQTSRIRFHLAEIKLLGANDTSSLPSPEPLPLIPEPPPLRVDLNRYLPAHPPVERFHLVGPHDFKPIMLPLKDGGVLFDPASRSNWLARIHDQVAEQQPRQGLRNDSPSVIVLVVQHQEAGGDNSQRMAAFQPWLRNRYATIGDLNSRWGTRFSNFEEVGWPQDRRSASQRDACIFMQQTITKLVQDAVATIRRHAPRTYIIGDVHGTGGLFRLDPYTLQREAGWSHFAFWFDSPGAGDCREFAEGGMQRSLISTLASRINRRLWDCAFIWSSPERDLSGRAARWQDAVFSRNLWLLSAAGMDGVTDIYKATPRVEPVLRQTRPFWRILGSSRPVTKLGIVHSASSWLMNPGTWYHEERLYQNFWSAGWQPAVIYEETFRDFPKAMADYNMLALGSATHLPNWLQDSLLTWVEQGGTLFCSEPPGLFDPWGKRLARLLWETFGIDAARNEADDDESGRTPPRWHINTAQLKPGCTVLASDTKGEPLALRTRYGRGEIVMTLVPFERVDELAGNAGANSPTKTFRDQWLALLNERVKREIESPERNLYLDWRPCDDPRTFFSVAINLSPYVPVKTQVIAHGAYSRVLNLSADGGANPVPCERTQSITSFPLELPPGGGAVLMLERAGKPARRR